MIGGPATQAERLLGGQDLPKASTAEAASGTERLDLSNNPLDGVLAQYLPHLRIDLHSQQPDVLTNPTPSPAVAGMIGVVILTCPARSAPDRIRGWLTCLTVNSSKMAYN